jgi:hypothetical protein
MASSKTAQLTDFSVDILGRYMCNGLDEAMHSMDKNGQRPRGCSTLSTEAPLEECVDTAESGGVAILIER